MEVLLKRTKLNKSIVKQMLNLSFSSIAKEEKIEVLGYIIRDKGMKQVLVYIESRKDCFLINYGWWYCERDNSIEKSGYQSVTFEEGTDTKAVFEKYQDILKQSDEKGHIYL